MRDLRKARKTLQRLAILPEVEEILPKSYTSTERAKALIATSDWLGADHCCDCGLQSDYCSCDFVKFGKYLPKPNLLARTIFNKQSGELTTTKPELERIETLNPDGSFVIGTVSTVKILSREDALLQRLKRIQEKRDADPTFYKGMRAQARFQPQSGSMPVGVGSTTLPTLNGTNILDCVDQPGSHMYDAKGVIDDTRSEQDDPDTFLVDFFKRPIWIYSSDWGTGTTYGDTFDPWALYLESPRIRDRLRNFRMMRGKLHLKFVINGNGFQYGRLLANYLPLQDWDDFSSNAFLIPEDAVQASQQQHLYLNPTTSTGGEMILPFFHYQNNISVPYQQWREMGTCYIRSLNTLKHANGASDSCTVNVFAWMEDAVVTGLTHLIAQSGAEVDEANMKGVISGPATAIANAATALEDIDLIRPYAKATSKVATTVANAAKMVGLSRPSVTHEPDPFVPRATGNLATCTVPDNAVKLSVDDKQELSIDPTIAGSCDVDPLNIREIAMRESYLTKFAWNMSTLPGTLLWNARVTPYSFAESAGGALHIPACCAVAMPFSYWAGSMRYRFQVVCSAFHKGRLQVSFDAMFPDPALQEFVSSYNRIVDISQETDFTVEISPSQSVPFLQHCRPGEIAQSEIFSTTPFVATGDPAHNGVISISVLNQLTTPNSTVDNSIEINVFISAGDDFEVAVPHDLITRYEFKPQSGLEVVDGLGIDSDEPQNKNIKILNQKVITHPMRNLVFMGERITSLRTLLKRYSHWRSFGIASVDSAVMASYRCRHLMFPFWKGRVAGAIDVTAAATPYNYVNTTLLHWVAIAFQGFRGSIRYKLMPRALGSSIGMSIAANRVTPHVGDAAWAEGVTGETPTNFEAFRYAGMHREGALGVPDPVSPPHFINGGTYNNSSINNTLEFEVPFYSNLRFAPCKRANLTTTNTVMEDLVDIHLTTMRVNHTQALYDQLVAVGEDFQLYQWVGMPRIYYDSVPPIP